MMTILKQLQFLGVGRDRVAQYDSDNNNDDVVGTFCVLTDDDTYDDNNNDDAGEQLQF